MRCLATCGLRPTNQLYTPQNIQSRSSSSGQAWVPCGGPTAAHAPPAAGRAQSHCCSSVPSRLRRRGRCAAATSPSRWLCEASLAACAYEAPTPVCHLLVVSMTRQQNEQTEVQVKMADDHTQPMRIRTLECGRTLRCRRRPRPCCSEAHWRRRRRRRRAAQPSIHCACIVLSQWPPRAGSKASR